MGVGVICSVIFYESVHPHRDHYIGATAVQVIMSEHAGKKSMTHIASAHDEHELALLKAEAQRVIDGDQLSLDLGLSASARLASTGSKINPLLVNAQKSEVLLDCIDTCYQRLGLDVATGGDQVFADLVRARIIQPGSKFDSIKTLDQVGVTSASYATIKRHLSGYAVHGGGWKGFFCWLESVILGFGKCGCGGSPRVLCCAGT